LWLIIAVVRTYILLLSSELIASLFVPRIVLKKRVMEINLLSSSSDSSSEDEEIVFVRRQKLYRNREDCFEKFDEVEFFERFRLIKTTVVALLDLIEQQISSPTNR
jgi:hypothetical protein